MSGEARVKINESDYDEKIHTLADQESEKTDQKSEKPVSQWNVDTCKKWLEDGGHKYDPEKVKTKKALQDLIRSINEAQKNTDNNE